MCSLTCAASELIRLVRRHSRAVSCSDDCVYSQLSAFQVHLYHPSYPTLTIAPLHTFEIRNRNCQCILHLLSAWYGSSRELVD